MVLKGERQGLELKFFELTQKILAECGLEFYEMEWNSSSGNLTVFIMNPETKTATLEDCVKVDRAFNPYVESEEWIPENFTLEVSSPGLFKKLSQVSHFESVEGEEISLHLNEKIDSDLYPDFPKALKNSLKIKVRLLKAHENSIVFEAKGSRVEIPYGQIKKANLETDFNNHNNKTK